MKIHDPQELHSSGEGWLGRRHELRIGRAVIVQRADGPFTFMPVCDTEATPDLRRVKPIATRETETEVYEDDGR